MVSVFSTLLGSTADTCSASLYEAFWKNPTRFLLVIVGRRIFPVVAQMLFPMVLIVQKTIEIPRLLVDTMADVPFVLVV